MNVEDIIVEKRCRIVFMGTPDFAVPILQGLFENYDETPIKKFCKEHNILVIQPEKIQDAEGEIFAWKPDLIVTCAYGQILPVTILQFPRLGCINVHASLLPKLRGGAPIHRAILNGHRKNK